MEKLSRSCEDQTRLTIEQVYPNICHMVNDYLSRTACHTGLHKIGLSLNKTDMTEFNDLILKYTKENILKINIYIKEPFARKYLMVEYASM